MFQPWFSCRHRIMATIQLYAFVLSCLVLLACALFFRVIDVEDLELSPINAYFSITCKGVRGSAVTSLLIRSVFVCGCFPLR